VQVETENLIPEKFQGGYVVLIGRTNDSVEFMGEDESIVWPNYPGRIFPYESTAVSSSPCLFIALSTYCMLIA